MKGIIGHVSRIFIGKSTEAGTFVLRCYSSTYKNGSLKNIIKFAHSFITSGFMSRKGLEMMAMFTLAANGNFTHFIARK